MAGIFDDLVPQQSGASDDLFADLVPKNYTPPPLPPARPSQEELISALGIGSGAPLPPPAPERELPPMPAPALSGIIGDTTSKLDAQLGQQADAPVGPPIPTNMPVPPRRPDAAPLEAPLPPINPAFNPADTRGLSLELPADLKMRDSRGSQGNPTWLGDTNVSIEESTKSVNDGIKAAEKVVEETAERARQARERWEKVAKSFEGRPAPRPGSATAVHIDTVRAQAEKEELAYSEAVKTLGAARQAQGPSLAPHADFSRRAVEATATMPFDAAAGALRIPDAILGTKYQNLASGPAKISKFISDNIHEDKARNDELIAGLGQGVGSAAGFVLGGAGLKALGVSQRVASTLLGGFQQAETKYREAEALGMKGLDLAKNYAAGFVTGGTEGVMGVGAILDDLERATGGGLTRYLGLILKEKGEEGFQEGVQTLMENLQDKHLLGKNVNFEDGLGHAILIGSLVGGGTAALMGAPALAAELAMPKPAELDPETQAAILRELRIGPAPITAEGPQNGPTPPPPPGAGAGGTGAAPQQAPLEAAPAPAPDAGNPAGFPAGSGDPAAGNVGPVGGEPPVQPDLGSVPGELGTEALKAGTAPETQPVSEGPLPTEGNALSGQAPDPAPSSMLENGKSSAETQPVSQDEQDLRLLMGDGWDLETAQDIMKSRGERAQAIREAQERGVQPVEGPIPGYQPETQPVSEPSSSASAPQQASDARGGAPNAKDAPSVASLPQAQPPSTEPSLATGPSSTGTQGGSEETPPRNNSSTRPYPKDLAELRAGLPRDEKGDPDYTALGTATAEVTGKDQPWGRLSQEEKQAVWDRLNGAQPVENQSNATGTSAAIAGDSGENPAGLSQPSQLSQGSQQETQPVSGPAKTPGTNLQWSSLKEWTDGAHTLNRRPHSTPRYAQEKAHFEELAKRPDLIKNASESELRDFIDALGGRIHSLNKPVPSAKGTTWERLHQLATDRLAQIEQGRADKPKTPRQDKRQPKNLLELIAKNGGLAPSTELTMRDLHNHFIPGFGRLVRKGGMDIDKARELANEHGYLQNGSWNDVLNLIEGLANKKADPRTLAEQNYEDESEQDDAQRQHEISNAIQEAMDEAGLGSQVDEEALSLAVDLVMQGEPDLLNAYERAIMQLEARDPETASEFDEADIPFEAYDEETFGEADPQGRDDLEEQGDEASQARSEERDDDAEEGQRPATDGRNEGDPRGDGSDDGAGTVSDTGTRSGEVSEAELLDEAILEGLEDVKRNKGANTPGSVRKTLIDEGYAKGGSKLQLTDKGKQALTDEYDRRREAERDPIAEDLIERGLMSSYQDTINLGGMPWVNGKQLHSFEPSYSPSRKFSFALRYDRQPGGGSVYVQDERLLKDPAVMAWADEAGIDVEYRPHPYPHNDHGSWHHAVDLATNKHWPKLVESQEFTTKSDIAGAIAFHVSHTNREGSNMGELSTDNARKLAAATGLEDPGYAQGIQDLFDHMDLSKKPKDHKGKDVPGYFVNFHIGGVGKKTDEVRIRQAFAQIHGFENGYLKHDRSGFMQPTQKLLDLKNGELDLDEAKKGGKPAPAKKAEKPKAPEEAIRAGELPVADAREAKRLRNRLEMEIPDGFTVQDGAFGRVRIKNDSGFEMEMALNTERDLQSFLDAAKENIPFKPGQKKPAKAEKPKPEGPYHVVRVSNDAVESLKAVGIKFSNPLQSNDYNTMYAFPKAEFDKLRHHIENAFEESINGPDMPKGWGVTRTYLKEEAFEIDQKKGKDLGTVTWGGETFKGVGFKTIFAIEDKRRSNANKAAVVANKAAGSRTNYPAEWLAAHNAEMKRLEAKQLKEVQELVAADKASRPTLAQQINAIKNDSSGRPVKAGDKLYSAAHKRSIPISQEAIDQAPQKGPTATENAASPHRDPKYPARTDDQGRTAIGGNDEGYTLWEDSRGVRSYVDDAGIRHTEKVAIAPDGTITRTQRDDTRFQTPTERPWPPVGQKPTGELSKPKTLAEVNEEYLARKGRYLADMDGASEEDQWTLTQDFIKARIPELFVLFPGRLTFERIAGNLGDPIRGGLFGEAEVEEALDDLVEAGVVVKDGKSYVLGSVKAQEGAAWDGVETMSPDKIFPTPPKKVFSADAVTETLTQAQANARIQEWKDRAKEIGETEDNSHKVVFSLFDRTGVWSQPWEDAGYTVIRYDITNGDDLLANFPVHDLLNARTKTDSTGKPFEVVGVLAAPPCTSFASSGARWWDTQHDVPGMVAEKYGLWAAEYFDTPLEYATTLVAATEAIIELANPTQFHVLENPIGRIQSETGLPDPVLQWEPHHYGDPYTKKTHLWGVFNPNLPTANVEPVEGSLISKLRGDLLEDKLKRSETPEGFAYAFFMGNHPGAMVTAEKGADGKPQLVIPGAEQDPKGAAQIKADAPLKPKAPQRPLEDGLFGDGHKQGDLLDNLGPATVSSDPIPARLKRLREQITVFASGMSRIGDLTAATWTFGDFKSRGVGTVADELSKNGVDHLARAIISRKVQAFIDSGAFNHFQRVIKGQNPAPMDWDAVLGKYEALQERLAYYNDPSSRPERPLDEDGEEIFADLEDWADEEDYFRMGFGREDEFPTPLVVMPDVVGDQAASLELLEKFSVHIQDELQFGTTAPIIPIQKGDLTMAEAYAQAVEILGTDNFIVGIPSNKKALTDEELKEFLEEARPRKIHFLGAAAPKNLDPKLQILAQVGLELEHLSADGNMARGADFGDAAIKEQHGRPMAVGEALETKSPEAYEGRELHEVLGEKVRQGLVPNIVQARKIAKAMGEEDTKKVEEALEFGVVLQARRIAQQYAAAPDYAYEQLVTLYNNQPILGTRTSTSMLNQAYSTPIPLAYVASRLAGISKSDFVLEPSAGNGALLIEANPQYTFANEINPSRRANLEKQGFHVTGEDASDGVPQIDEMDVVIANPPFGVVKDEIGDSTEFDMTDIQKGYRTKEIDHAISLRALAEMKADGRAVLIIGSVNPQKDRSQGYRGKAKNEFFLTLLKNYNVTEIFTVDGSLYKKQGAGWPVDVIVIQGRGASSLDHPAKTVPPMLSSWEEVGAKLNGIERPEGSGPRTGSGDTGVGAGSGSSVDAVRGDAGQSGQSELQPSADGQPTEVPSRPDSGKRGSGNQSGGSGGRGGSRGSTRSGGTSGDVSTKDALAAAMDEFYGGETAPAAESDPKVQQAQAFRERLLKTGEFLEGDTAYTVSASGNRWKVWTKLPGGTLGTRDHITREDAVEEAIRTKFGVQYGKPDHVGASLFRLNLNDAADFALGRNGFTKAEKQANRFLDSAEGYIDQYGTDPDFIAAVKDDLPLYRKTAKAISREPKPLKAPRAKPAKAAIVNVAQGIKEAGDGLFVLFGGKDPGKLNSGFTFNEETYKAAKPLFLKAIAHLKDAAANVMQMARELVGYMRNTLKASKAMMDEMLPYLERFIDEVRGGTATQQEQGKAFDDQDLENAPEAFQGNPQQADDLEETANQVTYRPRSGIFGLGTLVPTNMRNATEVALERLEQKVGNLEQYVGTKLGYKNDEQGPYFIRNGMKERPFAAEQIDALALAIDNMERGAALVIGDQTGIGKGRVNAGIIRYAMEQKKVPIFTTFAPGLYKDIYRDLTDIGIQEYLGREPKLLMTNAAKSIPLDDDGVMTLKTPDGKATDKILAKIAKQGHLGDYDALLTTYSQMQTVKGQPTQRMATLEALADKAILALDESHNAGGQDIDAEAKHAAKVRAWEKRAKKAAKAGKPFNEPEPQMVPDRAQFARILIDKAVAAFYSSATYAKRPDVMDLYRKTDMRLAVEKISDLATAIAEGGVPMQQVVASMLARAGQYVRRERSFAGVEYLPSVVSVDEELYDSFSSALAQIQEFSKLVAEVTAGIDEGLKGTGTKVGHDNATGKPGADSMNFTSIMHNLINQMLLSINAMPSAQAAIEAIRRGEKPLIALANTNESFLADYVKEIGANVGDDIDLDMSAMLKRYLERSRWISVREPFMEEGDEAEKIRLSDEEIGPEGVELFNSITTFLEETDFSGLPASPVDYIKGQLTKAGITVGEITGRGLVIDYTGNRPTLATRPGAERTTAGKNKTMAGFNSGEIQALILNQSGSTGFSMHASSKFKDQSKRVMIIAQPEGNIDVHMQMLGRIHRTGQVVLPRYIQLIPDVPAAKRPAAILLKKMASLNANTTANRTSALTADGVVDFMNEYGDAVATILMRDDPELNERMDYPVDLEKKDNEGAMRKLTGRIPILHVQEQKDLYAKIEETYNEYLAQLEAEGKNTLEAKTLELDAVPLRTVQAQDGDNRSPFTEPVFMTEYDVKSTGRPYQVSELVEDLSKGVEATLTPDPLTALREAEEMGQRLVNQLVDDAILGFGPFKEKFLGKIKDEDKKKKQQDRLNDQENTFKAITALTYPGSRVRLKFADDDSVSGIVIRVTPPKAGAPNPIAPGQWKVKIAVPTGARSYEFPFTRFVIGAEPEADQIAIENAGWSEPVEATLKLFEMAATAPQRETRVIATGNLLKAFTTVAKKGSIINFQTRDGQTLPGILLRDKVKSLATAMEGKRVALSLAQAEKQLRDGGAMEMLETDDGFLKIINTGRGIFQLQASKAKDKGGKYFLNKPLLEALGKEFYSQGSTMRVDVLDHKLTSVLQAILNAGGKITVGATLDEAAIQVHPDAPPVKNQTRAKGLYSATLKAAENAKIKKGTGKQWLSTLLNTPGIKAEEVAWIGLDAWLTDQKSVTKDEVVAFIRENQVEVREVTKGGISEEEILKHAKDLYEDELTEKVENYLERFGDNRVEFWAEAYPEEDTSSSGWEGTGLEDEQDDDLFELSGESRPTTGRWVYAIRTDESVEEHWKTYATEEEAIRAGEIEADRRNSSQYDDIRTEVANNRMKPWEYYVEAAREYFQNEDGRATSYATYQLPGGTAYREVLLTLAPKMLPLTFSVVRNPESEIAAGAVPWAVQNDVSGKRIMGFFTEEEAIEYARSANEEGAAEGYLEEASGEQYRSSHWAEKNIIVHARMNERTLGGQRTLFIEEIQSDWHQQGRKQGYKSVGKRFEVFDPRDGKVVTAFSELNEAQDYVLEQEKLGNYHLDYEDVLWKKAPDGPFKTSWHELALKRLIRMAVDEGYDQVAWTSGIMQAERYGLDKEGMEGFYDRILPAAADKLGKRFGARVQKFGTKVPAILYELQYWQGQGGWTIVETKTQEGIGKFFREREAAQAYLEENYEAEAPVHLLPVTPSMKLAATVDGFPLFQVKQTPADRTQLQQARQALITDIKDRIIGPHVDLRFETPDSTDESMQASTGQRDPSKLDTIASYSAERIIRIGLGGDAESIYHEVFHAFQHLGAFTPTEIRLLERERARNRKFVAKYHGWIDDPTEIDAYAAGLYGKFADQNAPGKMVGLHIGLRQAFEKVRRFFRRVVNLLKGYGFQVSEDIFERSRSGELRRRLDDGKGMGQGGSGYGDQWEYEVTRAAAVVTWAQIEAMEAAAPVRNMATYSQAAIDEVAALNAANGITPRAPGAAPSFPTPVETFLDRVRAHQQDSYRYLEKLQDSITAHRGAPLAEPADAYVAQIVYPGRRDSRLEDFQRDHVDPLIKAIQNAKVSTDEVGLYLTAKHARERNALMATRDPKRFSHDNGSGMADATADDLILKYRAEGKEAALEAIAQRVYAILELDKDIRHTAGLISDETRDHWDNLFPSGRYVPLRGFAERDEEHAGSHYGQGFDIRGREAKQATGRESLSDNPLMAAVQMAFEGITRAEKNIAGKSLLRLVKSAPNDEVWVVLRNPKRKYIDERTGLAREIPDNIALQRNDVIGVKVGGTPYYIQIKNENLALAYKNMGAPQFGAVTQSVATWTRRFASLQTGRNPEFFFPNVIRDIQEAFVTLDATDKRLRTPFLKNLIPAFWAAQKIARGKSAGAAWDKVYEEWRLDGGKISVFGFKDMETIGREINREIRRANWSKGKRLPFTVGRAVIRFIDGVNEVFENMTRLAVYKAARENGYGGQRKRAAALAREATINFTKRGRASSWMNAYFAFYNASVQGNAKAVNLLVRSPRMRMAWAGMTGLGFMMAMMTRFMWPDDEDPEGLSLWDHIPEHEKRSHIIIPYGKIKDAQGNTRLDYAKIPLAFGFKIPYYLGMTAADVIFGKKEAGKAAWDVFTNTLDAFNPMGDGQLLTMVFPTLTKPIPELLTNQNWMGRNIYPEREQWNEGLPRASQPTNAATPEWAVSTTELINRTTGGDKYNAGWADIYPGQVDYAVGWVTGGLGRFVANTYQTGANVLEGGTTPPERWPLARRFLGETNGSAEASRYYENREEETKHKNRFTAAKRAAAEDPDDEAALDTYLREGERLGVKTGNPSKKVDWKQSSTRLIEDADEVIKGMRQERQRVLSDKSLPLADRQRQAKDLESQIWSMQRDTRRDLKAMTAPEPAPAQTSGIQREEVGIRQEGIWDKLFGSSGPKTIAAETDQPFPTNEDLSFARKSGVFYGRDEAFLNGDRARIYGSVEKTTVPPPKGAKKGAKPTVLESFRAEATPDGKLSSIMESLTDPRKTSIQPVEDPQLRDDLGRAALAAGRTALSTLGYRPRRTTLDTKSGPSNLGGAYNPESDEGLILTQGNPSTPTHEAIHRGIDRVRKARPDLFKDFEPDEETMVRQIMRTKMGNPEQGKGSIADKQLARSKFWFEETIGAKANRNRLDEIEAAAAELIRQDRPRGGPR